MKCAKCGAELKTGCIYCSVCGQEAQIVSEYNLLEDDFLRELLQEEEGGQPSPKEAETPRDRKEKTEKKQKKNKIPLVVGASGAAVLLAAVLVFAVVRHTQNNSFSYQTKQAAKWEEKGQYEKAAAYLNRALELDESSPDTWMELADVYRKQKDVESAIGSLEAAIRQDNSNPAPFRELIELYEEEKDYESIVALAAQTKNREVLELFEDYLADPPRFQQEPGNYEEPVLLKMEAKNGSAVYYTLDGSDPKEDGKRYQEPVELPEGEVTVRAVSCNEFGIYSEELSGSYQIEFQPPDMPSVIPEGGIFHSPQTIIIRVPKECRVYYTWDGSDPTEQSQRYEAPVEIPEGNNILSVVAVSRHGVSSKVLKCNFTYLP